MDAAESRDGGRLRPTPKPPTQGRDFRRGLPRSYTGAPKEVRLPGFLRVHRRGSPRVPGDAGSEEGPPSLKQEGRRGGRRSGSYDSDLCPSLRIVSGPTVRPRPGCTRPEIIRSPCRHPPTSPTDRPWGPGSVTGGTGPWRTHCPCETTCGTWTSTTP